MNNLYPAVTKMHLWKQSQFALTVVLDSSLQWEEKLQVAREQFGCRAVQLSRSQAHVGTSFKCKQKRGRDTGMSENHDSRKGIFTVCNSVNINLLISYGAFNYIRAICRNFASSFFQSQEQSVPLNF